VLAFDPACTAPEKFYAFPVTAFTFTNGKDELALNIDKSSLQGVRSFDHGLWRAYTTPAVITSWSSCSRSRRASSPPSCLWRSPGDSIVVEEAASGPRAFVSWLATDRVKSNRIDRPRDDRPQSRIDGAQRRRAALEYLP
jgi:hypothetical protein